MDEKDKLIEEQMKMIEQLTSSLEPTLKQLEDIRDAIKKVNDQLGFTDRVENIKMNIRLLGWDRVLQTYHPDNNINDPAAYQMFELVKYVYKTMKGKGEV